MKARLSLFVALSMAAAAVLIPALTVGAHAPSAQQLQAPAERVNYSQGGTLYGPLMNFVYELESQTDLMNVVKLTETLMGRDVVLAVLSNPPVYRPSDLVKSDKPIVLIVNNVHGGEVAGKDAAMEIMRDLVQGDLRPLLDEVVVLVVPTINPDGAEVRRRTNEEGFDMNRDYIKLESQEVHALVTKVIQEWQPDIWVDTHHGGSAPYTLTYQTNMNPAGDQGLVAFGNDRILSRVRQALRAEDYDGFWYTGVGNVNGVEGWVPTSVEPRKQHVFATLSNTVGFLYETPSSSHRVMNDGTEVVPIPEGERYRHQVRGQYIGQRELIRFAAEEGEDLKAVVAAARDGAIRRGNDDADDDQIVLDYEQVAKYEDSYWRRVGGRGRGGGGRGNGGEVTYELVTGPVFTKFEPTRTTTRPYGYLLPPSMTRLVPILLEHDITVKRLTEPVALEVEAYDATAVEDTQYFQAHYLKAVTAEKVTETVEFPAGTFFVPSGQPMSNFISYILEPETNDNLVTWGYLDNVLRATPSVEEQEAQRRAQEERLAQMTPEQREQMQGRGGRGFGGGAGRPQRVPIYRLMKRADVAGELVQPFNEYERNRYIR